MNVTPAMKQSSLVYRSFFDHRPSSWMPWQCLIVHPCSLWFTVKHRVQEGTYAIITVHVYKQYCHFKGHHCIGEGPFIDLLFLLFVILLTSFRQLSVVFLSSFCNLSVIFPSSFRHLSVIFLSFLYHLSVIIMSFCLSVFLYFCLFVFLSFCLSSSNFI